jgi:hypothetical protein
MESMPVMNATMNLGQIYIFSPIYFPPPSPNLILKYNIRAIYIFPFYNFQLSILRNKYCHQCISTTIH